VFRKKRVVLLDHTQDPRESETPYPMLGERYISALELLLEEGRGVLLV